MADSLSGMEHTHFLTWRQRPPRLASGQVTLGAREQAGRVGVADELKIWGDLWMPKGVPR